MEIKNRIVMQRLTKPRKIIKDYLTRKDAITAFYEICDSKGYPYGKPLYQIDNGIKTQVGMETNSNDYRIVLYI